ncbi:hypothetical protein ASD89_24090 [Caulobacter sp. Root656]|nr:hypothetical protein ASD89_24090 [Caulobacter sp. Root656]
MTLPLVQNPFELFLGLNGAALNGGKVYIGVAGMDPQTNPQQVFWDAAGTVPAAQPLPTQGGYVMRAGTPARVYTASPFSMRVRDRFDVQVFYAATIESDSISSLGITALGLEIITSGTPEGVKAAIELEGYTKDTNTALGERAGETATGDRNVYVGDTAGYGAIGSNNVYVGATTGEGANGQRNVYISPIAMRYRSGDSGVGIGYAAGENVDGNRHIFIGDHAGAPPYTQILLAAPSTNPTTNVVTTNKPTYGGSPVTLTIGKTYRLQFENGAGVAPLPLASVSTLVTCQAINATTIDWLVTSYDVTTAGSAGYVVGLCYYHWDDLICVGSTSPDGPNQIAIGFDNSREFLPPNDGLTSLGRSPEEAAAYGTRGPYRWRGVSARYLGAWASAGETAGIDFGLGAVRRGKLVVDGSSANMQFVVYDATGASIGTPLELDNSRGTIRPRVIVNAASDAAAAGAGVPVGEMYRNGSVLMVRVS